jgi:hypothetical protein
MALPAFLDRQPTNIVWKTPLPGTSDAQPIILGDRLVTLCHPDYVVCMSAHDGAVLWQDRVGPMTCDGLGDAEARKRQEVFDIARAVRLLGYVRPAKQAGKPDPRQAILGRLQAMKTRMATLAPEFLEGIDNAIATVKESLAQDPEGRRPISLHQLARGVAEAYQVPALQQWDGGYVTKAACTPISDGEKIWVTFGHGQTACYDLNGRRLWSTRVKTSEVSDTSYYSNPLLCGRVLVVCPLSGTFLYGYDADTGQVLWKVSFREYRNKDRFISPHLTRLALPNGEALDVIITPTDQMIRARDGKLVGRFPSSRDRDWEYGRGLDRVGLGNLVLMTTQRHVGLNYGVAAVFSLKAENADAVTATPHHLKGPDGRSLYVDRDDPSGQGEKRLGWANVALMPNGILIAPMRLPQQKADHWDSRTANMWDLRTGQFQQTAFTPAARSSDGQTEVYGVGFTVIGKYLMSPDLIGSESDSPYPAVDGQGRRRADQLMAERLTIVDVGNPSAPQPIKSDNLLGTTEYPNDLYYDNYLNGDGLEKAWCCGQVFYSGFGLRTAGPTALGNRLWIQSATHLYCIGDPAVKYDWNPSSRPERITRTLLRR